MTEKQELETMKDFVKSAPRARNCEIMQYEEYAPHLTKEFIKQTIEEHSTAILEYVFIRHDKDENDDGTIKPPHWHIFLHFKESQKFDQVAQWFNVNTSFVNSLKSRNNYRIAFAYAVHFFDENKHQYDISEVITNIDYRDMLEGLDSDRKSTVHVIDYEKHPIIYYRKLYQYNAKKLREVELLYSNYLKIKSKERKSRKMDVLYFSAKPGTGKTMFARAYAETFYSSDEIFISSSSNDILDGYEGEKCIILDDLRDDALKYADLLKFLDNNTNSSVKSRYSNKQLIRCELVLITSIKEPRQLYEDVNESKVQLYRRIKGYMKLEGSIIDKNLVALEYVWNDKTLSYILRNKYDISDMVEKYISDNYQTIKTSFLDTLVTQGKIKPIDDKKEIDDKDLPF